MESKTDQKDRIVAANNNLIDVSTLELGTYKLVKPWHMFISSRGFITVEKEDDGALSLMWCTGLHDHYAGSKAVCVTITTEGKIKYLMSTSGRRWRFDFGDPMKPDDFLSFEKARDELKWFLAEIEKSRQKYGIKQCW